ncbi:hypothetical protein AnigIFM59636_005238 [Aspergillus niger]|nr:hypothetical protein AnigIFM59636_005238 [Aspergillus niger]
MHLRRIFVLTVLSYVTALPSDINLGVALRGCDVEACDMECRMAGSIGGNCGGNPALNLLGLPLLSTNTPNCTCSWSNSSSAGPVTLAATETLTDVESTTTTKTTTDRESVTATETTTDTESFTATQTKADTDSTTATQTVTDTQSLTATKSITEKQPTTATQTATDYGYANYSSHGVPHSYKDYYRYRICHSHSYTNYCDGHANIHIYNNCHPNRYPYSRSRGLLLLYRAGPTATAAPRAMIRSGTTCYVATRVDIAPSYPRH